MEYIPEDAPLWLIIFFALFKEPIIKAIGKRVPAIAAAYVTDRDDKREFQQDKELRLLQDKLSESESLREQSRRREENYFSLLTLSLEFSQTVLLERLGESESRIIDELKAIREAVDSLYRYVLNE